MVVIAIPLQVGRGRVPDMAVVPAHRQVPALGVDGGDVAEHFAAQDGQRDDDAAGLVEDPHVHPRAHPILGPYPASDPALAQDGVLLPVSPGGLFGILCGGTG